MKPGSPWLTRWLLVLLLVALLPGLKTASHAQGPEDDIAALALQTHLQNLRTYGFTAWVGGSLGDPLNAPAQTVMGQTLDDWSLTGLLNDDDATLASLTRPTLFNFWASWCGPCQLEFPDVVAAATAPQDHSFDVIFVNVFDTPSDARAYLSNYTTDIWTVLDPGDKLANTALIQSIPTSVLLDTDGTVLAVHTGYFTPTVARFLDAVAANPGVGSFDAADYPDAVPQAVLPPIDVESVPVIAFDQPQTGTITEENYMFPYRFEGVQGQHIEVTLDAVNSDLDPYLVVMAADGTRLGEHDDIDPGVVRNSIVEATLPADGTYLAVATRFLEAEGFEVGDFSLTVKWIGDSAPPPQTDDVSLRYGATVSGTLDDAQPEQRWAFAGQQGDVITLEMTRTVDEAGGLDGYMQVIGPDGDILTEVDDGPDSLMPLLKDFELPTTGTYTVVAARFGFANGFSAGEYTLTLTSAAAPAVDSAGQGGTGVRWFSGDQLPPDLGRIVYNRPVAGEISTADFEDWYLFNGRAGDVLYITMVAEQGDLDPFLLLTDAAGYELAQNDDAPDAGPDTELGFELPADGRYLIRATRYGFANGLSSGSYTLLIETSAAPVEDSSAAAIPLDFNQPAEGDLSLDQSSGRYTFEAASEEMITISAQPLSGNPDMGLTLFDPEGERIAANSGWLNPTEVRLNRLILPDGGVYTLEVTLEDFTTAGSYRLILLREPLPEPLSGAFQPSDGMDIEAVLIWSGGADLDLSVSAPDGSRPNRAASANDFCADLRPTPVEQITFASGTAAEGLYTVSVQYRLNCDRQAAPVQFILALVKNGQVELVGGTLALPGDAYMVPLEYSP